MGAEVTAVDSGIKKTMLLEIGADYFIDYEKQSLSVSHKTYDVIFNIVAGISYTQCISALNSGGRYLMANPQIIDMIRSVFTTRFSDKQAIFAFAGETKEELRALTKMIEEGKIKPVVDKVFQMEDAAIAHHRVESERRLGSIVITLVESNSDA